MFKTGIGKWGLMVIALITVVFIFSSKMASASQWIKTYGDTDGEIANSIQQTSDGGYIVAGVTTSFGAGNGDVWVLKLDGSGNVQWQKTYGGTMYDYAHSIQQTSDGGYIVAGVTYSFGVGGMDVWVFKLDGNGNVQWQKTYGSTWDDRANSIQQTSDSGYIVAGYTYIYGSVGTYGWLLKLDGNGNVQWQKTYGSTMGDYANSIQQTTDGGYIVAGNTRFSGGTTSVAWVCKIDGSGNVVWEKAYDRGISGGDFAYSIQQTTDGGYIVVGRAWVSNLCGWVFKLDGNGNVQWQKTYGDSGTFGYEAYSVQQTSDGGYIVAGRINVPFGNDAWLLKLDGNGNVQWHKTYGSTWDDYAHSIQQTSDGGYIVAGQTVSFGVGLGDAWVLKLDGNGNINNCSIVKSSNVQVSDTYATAQDTNLRWADPNVSPLTSTASISNTNAVVKDLCPDVSCSFTPAGSTTLFRGGLLIFWASANNNTDDPQTFDAATFVTLPPNGTGSKYPSSGYLVGPITITNLGAGLSATQYMTQSIPYNAPYGTYTYHGYVGVVGPPPLLYNQCQFNFEVVR